METFTQRVGWSCGYDIAERAKYHMTLKRNGFRFESVSEERRRKLDAVYLFRHLHRVAAQDGCLDLFLEGVRKGIQAVNPPKPAMDYSI